MRAIALGEASHGDETLQILNHTTLKPLIEKRNYVTLDAKHNPTLTEAGFKALETYENLAMPTRVKPGLVPHYVETMLAQQQRRRRRVA
jgi:hypothetical protein